MTEKTEPRGRHEALRAGVARYRNCRELFGAESDELLAARAVLQTHLDDLNNGMTQVVEFVMDDMPAPDTLHLKGTATVDVPLEDAPDAVLKAAESSTRPLVQDVVFGARIQFDEGSLEFECRPADGSAEDTHPLIALKAKMMSVVLAKIIENWLVEDINATIH